MAEEMRYRIDFLRCEDERMSACGGVLNVLNFSFLRLSDKDKIAVLDFCRDIIMSDSEK
jgi:hypothetical protein